MTEPVHSSAGALLRSALDEEIIRLESTLAWAGLLISWAGGLMALYTALTVAQGLGFMLLGFTMVLVLWFHAVLACVQRGIGVRVFQWVNPMVEVSLPSMLVLIDARSQGAEYAASSPVPLIFYAVFLLGSVVRLKRFMPLLAGAFAGVQYALIALFILRPQLPVELTANPAFRTEMLLMRAVVIVLAGGVAAVVNAAIVRAVGKASSEARANDLFGKYEVGELLAHGGMGTVHRALYCPEGGFVRPVALKRIHPHLAAQPRFVTAFRNEAELCARLTHPNIVQVMDFGRVGDTYFLAMEFVDGMTLTDMIKRSILARRLVPMGLVASIGREVCDGLAYAYSGARAADGSLLRVVHRDLNPPNVLLSSTGQVKITDFGLARALGEVREALTGNQEGKAGYLAPEQVRELPIDGRCDLFAVGIILWELTTLRRLFARSSLAATLNAVVQEPAPSPRVHRPDLGEHWDAFFARALCPGVEGRFQSAAEMRDELTRLLHAEGIPAPDALARHLGALPPAPASDEPTQPLVR